MIILYCQVEALEAELAAGLQQQAQSRKRRRGSDGDSDSEGDDTKVSRHESASVRTGSALWPWGWLAVLGGASRHACGL
jgi:hypothetical protein